MKKSFCFTSRADLAVCVDYIIRYMPFSSLETWGDGVPQVTFVCSQGDAANLAFYLNDKGVKFTPIS